MLEIRCGGRNGASQQDEFPRVQQSQRCSERRLKGRLVPRTRSSHDLAERAFANFGFKSGTRIMELLVSCDSEVRSRVSRKFGRTSESGH